MVASFPSYLIFLLLPVVYCVLVCGSFFFLFCFSPLELEWKCGKFYFNRYKHFVPTYCIRFTICPRQKLGVVRSFSSTFYFVIFFVCFSFVFVFLGLTFFSSFSSFVSLLFVCGPPDDRLGGVIGSVVPARVLYRIVEDLLPPV